MWVACLTTGTATVRPVHKVLTLATRMIRALHTHEYGVPRPYSTAIYFLAVRELVLCTVATSGRRPRACSCCGTYARSRPLSLRILIVSTVCTAMLATVLASLQRSRLTLILLLNRNALEIVRAIAGVDTRDLARSRLGIVALG